MLYSCCLPVLFYQLLNNIGFCEYGTKWSGISERTSYQINLQHRVELLTLSQEKRDILKPLSTPLSKKEGRKMPMISFPSPGRSLLILTDPVFESRAEKFLTGPVFAKAGRKKF